MAKTLRRYAGSLNKGDRYHETITIGFVALIYERLCGFNGSGWDAFRCAYPELLKKDALLAYYPQALLMSDRARKGFVLPPCEGGWAAMDDARGTAVATSHRDPAT